MRKSNRLIATRMHDSGGDSASSGGERSTSSSASASSGGITGAGGFDPRGAGEDKLRAAGYGEAVHVTRSRGRRSSSPQAPQPQSPDRGTKRSPSPGHEGGGPSTPSSGSPKVPRSPAGTGLPGSPRLGMGAAGAGVGDPEVGSNPGHGIEGLRRMLFGGRRQVRLFNNFPL